MMRACTIFAAALLAGALNGAAEPAALPAWVKADEGFRYPYSAEVAVVTATIAYPGAEPVSLNDESIRNGEGGITYIDVPPSTADDPGVATLRFSLADGEIVEEEVPVSHYREIDITGPAAESLYTPLPADDYLVDYIPCCNIYGGLLIAERIPVNPWETDAGLPENRLTDFVQLTPDGLTASTMGLYFEFGYESELPAEQIGLYEFGRSKWREVFDYSVDAEKKRVRFHCPDGGTFVVATGDVRATRKTD